MEKHISLVNPERVLVKTDSNDCTLTRNDSSRSSLEMDFPADMQRRLACKSEDLDNVPSKFKPVCKIFGFSNIA